MGKLRYLPPGTAPATLILPPEYQDVRPSKSLLEYDAHSFQEHRVETVDDLFPYLESEKISWINIDGLGDIEFFQQLALHFRIHPLALEDILNLGQRPKVEEYDCQLFIVLHMAHERKQQEMKFEQVSIVLTEKIVITVQERSGDVLNPVRQRLRDGVGNARFMRADYLAYALIDAVIDQYFPLIDSLGETLDNFQRSLLDQPTRERINEIHEFRRNIARIHRDVGLQRDVLGQLMRDESGLVAERTKLYFRDCYDNIVVMLDHLESFRDSTRNMMELYLTSTSIRTNEMVRVLTILASVFLPLTFIAGIYGMNFDPMRGRLNMPELEWPFGYLFAICLVLSVTIGILAFFKLKKWL